MSYDLNGILRNTEYFLKQNDKLLEKAYRRIYDNDDYDVKELLVEVAGQLRNEPDTGIAHEDIIPYSKRFIKRVFQAIPGILFIYDIETGTNTFINHRAGDIPGVNIGDLLKSKQHFLNHVHPDDRAIFKRIEKEEYANPEKRVIEYEYRIKRTDGHSVWMHVREVPFEVNDHNKLTKVLGIVQDITQAKKNSKHLQLLRERNQMLLDNTTQKFYLLNSAGEIIAINKKARDGLEKLMNREVKEGDRLINCLPAPVSRRFAEQFNKALREGRSNYEETINYGDDDEKTWRVSLTRIKGSETGIEDVIVEIVDLTEEKRYRSALLESEERLKLMAEGTELGLWDLYFNEKRLYCSDKIFDILGYNRDELEYTVNVFYELCHPEDLSQLKRVFDKHVRRGDKYAPEFRLKHKTGKYIWVKSAGKMIFNEQGKPARMVGSLENIDRNKRLMEQLKEREALLNGINQNINEGIYQSTDDAKLKYANDAFAKLFGYDSAEEITGKDFSSFALYNDKEDRRKLMKELNTKGYLYNYKIKYRKKDGSTFWALLNSRKTTEQGKVIYVGAVRDITPMMDMQEELRSAKQMAEEMNRLKSNFLANMSHEIRTPINGLLGLAQLIGETRDPKDLQEYSKLMSESGMRLLSTINSILDLAKLESEKGDFNVEKVDISPILKDIYDIFSIRAKEKGIEFTLDIEDTDTSVLGDEQMIRQILINILGNALKFTHKGYVKISVSRTVRRKTPICRVRIKDTGIGVSKEFLPKIFNAFQQERSSSKNKYQGTGLGLSISKRYAELLGGNISVKSEKGKGSEFTFNIPSAK